MKQKSTVDIIKAYIENHDGIDGLCNDDCGCTLEDFAPCGDGPFPDCVVAKSRILAESEFIGECGPGDVCLEPVDMAKRQEPV